MKKTVFLKLFIGFAVLGVLVYKIGLNKIISSISGMNIIYLIPILIAILLVNLLGTWKLMLLLTPAGIRVNFFRLYHLYFLSTSLSLFIPGRVGELLLIYFLKKEKVGLGAASALVAMDKIIAITNTFVLALGGIYLFFDASQSFWIINLFLISFSALIFIIFSTFGRSLVRRFILKRWESHFVGFSKTLLLIAKNNKAAITYNFFIGMVKWVISSSILYMLFKAFGQEVSIVMVLLATTTLALVAIIPISLSGLGLKESAGVALFAWAGMPAPVTTAVLLMLLIINYSVSALYIMLFFEKNIDLKKILE